MTDEPIREEPRYEDDPFNDGARYQVTGVGLFNTKLAYQALRAAGRSKMVFRDDVEVRLWKKVDAGVHKGTIHIEWVRLKFEHAQKHHWRFIGMTNAILNTAKMEDWAVKNVKPEIAEPPQMKTAEPKAPGIASND